MKNRLEVAKELLSENGVLIVAVDENEQAYLGVLLKEECVGKIVAADVRRLIQIRNSEF